MKKEKLSLLFILLIGQSLTWIASSHAGAQWVSSWETNIDAPWRVEPSPGFSDGNFAYPTIPISVTINDARAWQYTPDCGALEHNDLTVCDREETQLREVLSITVVDESSNQTTVFTPSQFHEIERTLGTWHPNTESNGSASNPAHAISQDLCRSHAGENCTARRSLENTSEWHATVLYTPTQQTPGSDLKLRVVVTVNYYSAHHEEVGEGTITQHLKVRLGDEPLPRFDSGWAYGDLHYHSQGTDNTGEYGVSYREVMHTASAIGMDFLFATEHASNNVQVREGTVDIKNGCYITGVVDFLSTELYRAPVFSSDDCINDLFRPTFGLGDMSPYRYMNHWSLLHGATGNSHTGFKGINHLSEILSVPRQRVSGNFSTPQIFLGGEVDIIPEVPTGSTQAGVIPGYIMSLEDICRDLPSSGSDQSLKPWLVNRSAYDVFHCQSGNCYDASARICEVGDLLTNTGDNTSMVKDIQFNNLDFARQHLLYLPADRDTLIPVLSNTNAEGGASKRLKNLLAQGDHAGYFFLAHPLAMESGNGPGRLGPDLIPYSEIQLKEVFRNESFLGLQGWNENTRLLTAATKALDNAHGTEESRESILDFEYLNQPVVDLDNWSFKERTYGNVRSNIANTILWDHVQLWGLDPAQTSDLSWLPSGEPRKIFFAGGSDAHGDFNFRREGAITGTSAMTDTAFGKPRNLVHVGTPQGESMGPATTALTQAQVTNALKSGEFSVTDGPAIRIALDMNGNGVVDAGDVSMGGTFSDSLPPSADGKYPLLVEWKSTTEFGPVSHLYLKIGSFSDDIGRGIVWGDGSYQEPGAVFLAQRSYVDSSGNNYTRRFFEATDTKNEIGYFRRQNGTPSYDGSGACHFEESAGGSILRIDMEDNPSGNAHRYQGVCRLDIDPEMFPAFKTTITTDHRYSPPKVTYGLSSNASPDRMFVRAEVYAKPLPSTCSPVLLGTTERCNVHRAHSNPVWIVR